MGSELSPAESNNDAAAGVNVGGITGAVAELRSATAWSGTVQNLVIPVVGRNGVDEALGEVKRLFEGLPRHYSSQFEVVADAVLQGAVDTHEVDMVRVPD